MWFWLAALVLSSTDENKVTENFTGKVLDGSNDRLTRVERLDVSKRSPNAIVTLQGCGPLETGGTHEFLTWAGAWEDVRACLAVDGRPHVPELLPGYGVVFGKVQELHEDSERSVPNVALKATCGERTFAGKADHRGRFWTMLPAGHCRVEIAAANFRSVDRQGLVVREGVAEVMAVRVRPWGLLERLEEWAGSVRNMFVND